MFLDSGCDVLSAFPVSCSCCFISSRHLIIPIELVRSGFSQELLASNGFHGWSLMFRPILRLLTNFFVCRFNTSVLNVNLEGLSSTINTIFTPLIKNISACSDKVILIIIIINWNEIETLIDECFRIKKFL